MWQKEEIIKKIDWCCHTYRKQRNDNRKYMFPIEDILMEFYRTAVCGLDFYSIENLNILYETYCNKNIEFRILLEDIISQGWISVILGRWESALHNKAFEQEDLTQYPNGDILQFLVWLRQQEKNGKPSVEVINPEDVLEKWRMVYPSVPELSWFKEQHFLCCMDEKYYAINGYRWRAEIDHALAKLWMILDNKDFRKWLNIARCVSGTYYILDFLDCESRQELLNQLLEECLFQYDIPSWSLYNEHYKTKHILETPKYALTPEKYSDIKWWIGNRALDINHYQRHWFEFERWYGVHADDYSLVHFSVMTHLDEFSDENILRVLPYMNAYDWIGSLYGLTEIRAENIYQLLTHGESMFLGFRYLLVQNGKNNQKDIILDIFKSVMLHAREQMDFFRGEEVGSCMLCLMDHAKEISLLKGMVELFADKACLQQCADELCIYFESLLRLENSVDWVRGYHLLLVCMDKWFYSGEEQQNLEIYRKMLELSWKGYGMIYGEEADYAPFLKEEYFTENICFDWYKTYIEHQTISQKRSIFLPEIQKDKLNTTNKSQYEYKLLLTILHRIYSKAKHSESFVKECIIEVLEQILIGEKPVFDYSRIQIFSAENVIQKSIGLLLLEDNVSKGLMNKMLQASVPDLLLYYHAAADEKFKEQIKAAIETHATKESLCVYDNEHALDLVMDEQIEALYLIVEETLGQQLEIWKSRGVPDTAPYVERAKHQRCRLRYLQKKYDEILSGDNQFFKAIVYMEVESYLDFAKSDVIWKKMISDRERKGYASSVFLNYMILLNRKLKSWDEMEAEERKYLDQQIAWITGIIEEEELDDWNEQEKKEYCYLIVESKKLRGKHFWQELCHYNEKLQLNLSPEEFSEVGEGGRIMEVDIGDTQLGNFVDDEAQGIVIEILNKLQDFQMRVMDFQKRGEVEITADLQDAVSGNLNTKYRIHLAREFTMGRALKKLGETDLYFYKEENGIKENIAVLENKCIENFKDQYLQLMGYLNQNFKFGITLSINRNRTVTEAENYIINCLNEIEDDFSVLEVKPENKGGFTYLVSEHIIPETGKRMKIYHLIFQLCDRKRVEAAKRARKK